MILSNWQESETGFTFGRYEWNGNKIVMRQQLVITAAEEGEVFEEKILVDDVWTLTENDADTIRREWQTSSEIWYMGIQGEIIFEFK